MNGDIFTFFIHIVFETQCIFYTSVHLDSYQSHFKYSTATCGYWLEYWTVQSLSLIIFPRDHWIPITVLA